LDLHRRAEGEGGNPDCRARMPAPLAKHLHHEVGGPVHDLRLIPEVRRRVDKADELYELDDALQITERGAGLGEDVDGAQARRLLAVLEANPGAELALAGQPARTHGQLAGYIEVAAARHRGDVVGR